MRYARTVKAEFLDRPNRFVALVRLNGEELHVHVKNTGRCRELLVPGAEVVLSESDNPARKYRYDLVAVRKNDLRVNIDSQAPNTLFHEWLLESHAFGQDASITPERTHGDSRFDFYIESEGRRIFAEVKGVTLEENGISMFPDAPTARGVKHIRGLMRAVEEGYEACMVFVIQMSGMKLFVPNESTDPDFSEVLREAYSRGVGITCLGCSVLEDGIQIDSEVPFDLGRKDHRASSCSRWCPSPPVF